MAQSPSQKDSLFHAGEQEAQERVGKRERVEALSKRAIRDHMPDQHREFYSMLPFVLVGAADENGRPWASLIAGRSGFISSPDARTLNITAKFLHGDPLHGILKPGAHVGLLGIELETRRRNRLTGKLGSINENGFSIIIDHTFGNCPQYIQTRTVETRSDAEATAEAIEEPSIIRSKRFDQRTRDLIEKSDTLFVATAFSDGEDRTSRGADASHRGGKPGFVHVEDEQTFVFPDFAGNNHFNTVGNILLNPVAGFLFVDFDNPRLVYMTGGAEVVWDDEEVRKFEGAERLIRFHAQEIVQVDNSLPFRFKFGELSHLLERTGSWD